MVLIKDNIKAYGALLKGVVTVSRVMAFEKFNMLFFVFYFLSILSVSLLLYVMHWSAGLLFFVISLFLFSKLLPTMEFLKRMLIRKGDRVEYADPKASARTDVFKKADVIMKMRLSEVKKTKLISNELIDENNHFYLVKTDKDATVIAYDWIVGLSPEILDMKFDFEDED